MRSTRNYSRKRRGLRKSMRGGRKSLRRNSRKSLRRKGRKSLRRKSLRRRGRKSLRGGMEDPQAIYVNREDMVSQQDPLYDQTGHLVGQEDADSDAVCDAEDTGSNKIKLLSQLLTKPGGVMIDTWINKHNKLMSKVPFIDDVGETGSKKLTLYSKLNAKIKAAIDPILDELWRTGVQMITNRCDVKPNNDFPFSETEEEWIEAKGDELYIMTRHHFHIGRGGGWGKKYYLYSNNFTDDEGYLYKLSFGHYPHLKGPGVATRAKMQYIKKPTN